MIGDKKVRSGRIVSNGIAFGASVTVSLNANTNDFLIPDLENTVELRIDNSGNNDLTGIVVPDDNVAQWVILFNVGSGNINLKDNSGLSSANNRFLMGANKTMQPDEGLAMIYDDVDKRWRIYGINI